MRTQKNYKIFGSILFSVVLFIIPLASSMALAQPTKDEMVKAAIKEGGLNWLDGIVVPTSAKVMAEEFKKHYGLPDSFTVKHERVRSGDLCTRIAEEVKAGKVQVDVFGVAVPTFFADLKKAGALLRYDSPEMKYYKHAREVNLPFDPGYYQTAVAYATVPVTNPKTCSKKITSWYDLLDPEFKGKKISLQTIMAGGSPLNSYIGWRQVLPRSFFQDLAKQDPTFDRGSSVDATQRLLQNEATVATTAAFRILQVTRQSGVEMTAHFPKEGVTLMGVIYAILDKSPHPNAAKLFYDFLFSEKGMNIYIYEEGTIAVRDGLKIPEEVKKYSPSLEEINAIPVDWSKIDNKMLKKYKEEVEEIFRR